MFDGEFKLVGVLPYETSVTYAKVTCVSAHSGMSCRDTTTGTGFALTNRQQLLNLLKCRRAGLSPCPAGRDRPGDGQIPTPWALGVWPAPGRSGSGSQRHPWRGASQHPACALYG